MYQNLGMHIRDCYRTLNISQNADWHEIKRAYRTLARLYHPDLNLGSLGHEAKFKKISQAYNKLEQHYKAHKSSKIICYYAPTAKKNNQKSEQTSLKKIFAVFISEKTRRQWQIYLERIKQILFEYERRAFPLDVVKAITLDTNKATTGSVVNVKTASESFQVKIPPTTQSQIEMLITEKGGKSFIKGKRGDLLLKISVVPSGVIGPGTTNFFYKMEVSREDIGNGKVLTLSTIQGPIKFFVPRRTLNGQTFVLKAKPKSSPTFKINHVLTLYVV